MQQLLPVVLHQVASIILAVVVMFLIICAVIGFCEIYDAVRQTATTESTSFADDCTLADEDEDEDEDEDDVCVWLRGMV